jgi:hypothetical protein
MFMTDTLSYLLSLLQHSRLLILKGGPGTGKSYWARRLGLEAAARHNQQRSFADLTPIEQDFLCDSLNGPVRSCNLYAGFDYGLFVEGYRSEMVQGQATQVLRSGAFKRIAQEARAHPDLGYFLILEDFQSVDPRALFGEVWGSLVTASADSGVALALSQERFVMPANLHLIATVAEGRGPWQPEPDLFRRFLCLQLTPDEALLAGVEIAGLSLQAYLHQLNQGLQAQNLPRLGPGFFFEQGQPVQTPEALAHLIWLRLLPLLLSQLSLAQAEKLLGAPLLALWQNPGPGALAWPGVDAVLGAVAVNGDGV